MQKKEAPRSEERRSGANVELRPHPDSTKKKTPAKKDMGRRTDARALLVAAALAFVVGRMTAPRGAGRGDVVRGYATGS